MSVSGRLPFGGLRLEAPTAVAACALLINSFLTLLYFTMSAFSGSLALAAEAAHTLVDVVAAAGVLGGIVLARKQRPDFPYGLYKVENIVSLGIAVAIFLTGFEIARLALQTPAQQVSVHPLMLAGITVGAALSWLYSRLALKVGRQSNSPSLIASGREFQGHILSSGVVLAAVAGQLWQIPLDRPAAFIVLLWIVKTGRDLFVDSLRALLDASLDRQTLQAIRAIVEKEAGVERVVSITGRNAGSFTFLELVVEVRAQDVVGAHQLSRRLEEQVRAANPHIERVLVHCEPVRRNALRYAVPLAGSGATVSPDFGEAGAFALLDVEIATGNLVNQEVRENAHQAEQKGRGLRVASFLIENGVNVLVVEEDLHGKGPGYALAAAGIRVLHFEGRQLGEAIDSVVRRDALAQAREDAPPARP